MSDTYISAELRRQVIIRAKRRCEYCDIAEADTYLGCEVDHIVREKHGGVTAAANLALACVICIRAKGSDIATVGDDGGVIQLFNPRLHLWSEHFAHEGDRIIGKTAIGRATVRFLKLNHPDLLAERDAQSRLDE